MTPSEFAQLCGMVAAWWPGKGWPEDTAAVYFRDVKDLDAEQVRTAAEALYREGSQWPFTGAQVRKKVVALAADVPTFSEVWHWLLNAAASFGRVRETEALEWLASRHPLAAELGRRLPFREFCMTTEIEVFHGQARRSWEGLVAQSERESELFGLAGAGLRAVERSNGPRSIAGALAGVVGGVERAGEAGSTGALAAVSEGSRPRSLNPDRGKP